MMEPSSGARAAACGPRAGMKPAPTRAGCPARRA